MKMQAAILMAFAACHCWNCANAQELSTLYAFQGRPDGFGPTALIYAAGSLYGTTGEGGTGNCIERGIKYHPDVGCGTIFSINPDTGKESVLYSFPGSKTGESPNGLIRVGGEIYGTTYTGGISGPPCSFIDRGRVRYVGCGVVFKFDLATGVQTVLHKFAGIDGEVPTGGLLAYKGQLYGTTTFGGAQNVGALFAVDPTSGAEKIVYSFTGGYQNPDGIHPDGNLIDQDGVVYGVTEIGGADGSGTVYSFNPATGAEAVLYSFTGSTDGSLPSSGLTYWNGKLYGVTPEGGVMSCASGIGCGTVYSVDPATGVETVLHAFTGGADGQFAMGTLAYQNGALYGTTPYGGASNCGVAFSVDINTGAEQVLYSFPCSGLDVGPQEGMLAENGVLYGIDPTYNGAGSVFRLVP
jgi:uncharacterized repeat protein (TIGR03803 family)